MALPEITPLEEYVDSINMLIYSDPGVGKTPLGGTCPNALIIATERGTVSAARYKSKADVMRIRHKDEFLDFVKAARRDQILNRNGEPYSWYVFDTLDEGQTILMRGLLEDAHADNAARDLDIPAMQDYLKHQRLFQRMIHAINDLPQNVLYLSHTMKVEAGDGTEQILPNIYGKNGTDDPSTMSRWVCGTVDAFGVMKVKQAEDGTEYRRLLCRPNGPYMGKDRFGVLTPHIDNPNMAEIEALIAAPSDGQEPVRTTKKKKG